MQQATLETEKAISKVRDWKAGLNQAHQGPDLAMVSMPIVRLMANGRLSWRQIEECANTLRAIESHWEGLESERRHLQGAGTVGQAQAAYQVPRR